ncbi:hypothetical protein ACFFMN_40270 [Planobispora siamensis]|uniref:Uncharacterized protein n=1 Tax=Planobispora siamensis TaxID=936338 RepID=A0A8J3WQA6_9ACTN|nr:hypothetical protein [Planobispora siamensis]GIH97850.1 hypothetical protein Psi01_84800 [Planobispora siamensis]
MAVFDARPRDVCEHEQGCCPEHGVTLRDHRDRAHVPPDVALRLDARLGADAWEPREPNTALPAVWPEQRSA